jgi:hypothetical protein
MATDPQLGDVDLRTRVRELIRTGWLPSMKTGEIAAGYGSGHICAVCSKPITSDQVEYDVEDRRNSGQLHLHLGCHAVWELECVPSD